MMMISTLRRCALHLGLALSMIGFAACGGSDGGGSGAVGEGCDRLDECNALRAGVSANECVEMVENDLDSLTESQRSDWETLMDGCLAFDTCELFIQCVDGNGL